MVHNLWLMRHTNISLLLNLNVPSGFKYGIEMSEYVLLVLNKKSHGSES